jgi:hypothetical protein
MSRPLNRPARLCLTTVVVTLMAIGCTPRSEPIDPPDSTAPTSSASTPPSSTPSGSPSPSTSVPPVGLLPSDIDTTIANKADMDGKRVAIRGFLLIEPAGARLCGLVLESYPPQCGGATIVVRGGIPPVILAQLDSSTDEPGLNPATWGDVVVTGTFHAADGPAIDVDGVTIPAPG